jgi:hypothetical protein
MAIIIDSVMPGVIEYWRHKRNAARQKS